MASLFERGSKIWITLKDENGKWIQRSTGYRHSNIIEKRAAEKLCRMQTLRERAGQPTRHGDWDWVDTWVNATWGGRGTTTTSARYSARWGMLLKFLKERGIAGPANLTREHCLEYVGWREKRGGGRNTTLDELQLLAQVIDEGIRREYCDRNPARKPGLKHDDRKEKRAWTDEELQRVDVELATRDPYNWMRVSFLLGRYQAARLGSCALPLDDIDLERGTIFYARPKGGRERAFTQPIDTRLLPTLREIVAHRRSIGATTLGDLPNLPSVEWRKFLDALEPPIRGVSHHSLRVTWITAAAKAGIPESMAQRFSNHSSTVVHRIYQRFTTEDMATMLKRLG